MGESGMCIPALCVYVASLLACPWIALWGNRNVASGYQSLQSQGPEETDKMM